MSLTNKAALTLEEAVRTRRSIRAFRPDPVPRETVEKILDLARFACSQMSGELHRELAEIAEFPSAGLRLLYRLLRLHCKFVPTNCHVCLP